MALPVYTASDFQRSLQARLPRGRVWPRDSDTLMTAVLGVMAPTAARVSQNASDLLVDAFPASTEQLLPEWEASLGLPDPCAGLSPTIEQRRAQVVARFAGNGGQSVEYFTEYAANLGYTITIQQFAPLRFGDTYGEPMLGTAWAFAWQINGPVYTVTRAEYGAAVFGEPYAAWGNDVLQCELRRLAPAHTTVLFNYS